MRKLMILSVLAPILALAACAENTGWNPNYSAMHNGSPYAKYLQTREAALQGQGPVPQVIPVQLPAEAPQVVLPKRQIGAVRVVAAEVPANAQVATTGPYPGSTPVLVRYAHQQPQNPGATVYQRTGGSIAQAARLCSNYPSRDAAQRAFIASGGPLIDPRGMDPDGDGYVGGWDPKPFRAPR